MEGAYFSLRNSAQARLLSDMEGLQLLVGPEEERDPGVTGCTQSVTGTWAMGHSRPHAVRGNLVGRVPCGVHSNPQIVGS